MSIQVIYFHTHGHPWHPQCIHMITLPPLLHHPQVFFYLQLLVWHTEFSHQEIILYQLLLLLTTPVDTPTHGSTSVPTSDQKDSTSETAQNLPY